MCCSAAILRIGAGPNEQDGAEAVAGYVAPCISSLT